MIEKECETEEYDLIIEENLGKNEYPEKRMGDQYQNHVSLMASVMTKVTRKARPESQANKSHLTNGLLVKIHATVNLSQSYLITSYES